MNETRKKIIELIEPYMDKTLEEGCIIEISQKKEYGKVIDVKPHYDRITEFSKYEMYGGSFKYNLTPGFTEKMNGWGWNKIIGHYDITAVLKYIERKYEIKVLEDTFYIKIPGRISIHIPNKPLYLYTEQEEKELLELLTKLKNTKG